MDPNAYGTIPAPVARRPPLRTAGFWLTALGVVLAAFLGGGGAFVASDDEPAILGAALLLVIAVASLGALIVHLGGWSPAIVWGLLGGVALLIALVAILFVIGLVLLLGFVMIWIVQASRQP